MMWISLSSTWELWSNEDGRFPGSLEKKVASQESGCRSVPHGILGWWKTHQRAAGTLTRKGDTKIHLPAYQPTAAAALSQ